MMELIFWGTVILAAVLIVLACPLNDEENERGDGS